MKSPYYVRFGSLSEGQHEFDFELDRAFFVSFDQEEILDAKVKAELMLIKRSNGLELIFEIKGNLILPCDSCLEAADIPFESFETLHVRFGETEDLESEIIVLDNSAYELDLKQFLYEYCMLALPMQKMHDFDCTESDQSEEKEEHIETDPRWEALKNLKLKEK